MASDYGLRIKQVFGLSEELWETFRPYAGAQALMLNAILLRPKSKGWVRLQSTDPYQHPLIDPKFFSDEYDLDVMVEGLKIALQIGQTPPLQKYGAWPITRKYPGCENYKIYSDQYLRCMAQTLTLHPYHAVGTCKMGPKGDRTAVVDLDLKVKGVTGLRVVDASVIPNHISGNTNIPVIAIAEKIADQMRGRRIKPMLPPMERNFVFKLPNLPYDNITVEDNQTKANSSQTQMV